jgi:hypothetical protein
MRHGKIEAKTKRRQDRELRDDGHADFPAIAEISAWPEDGPVEVAPPELKAPTAGGSGDLLGMCWNGLKSLDNLIHSGFELCESEYLLQVT